MRKRFRIEHVRANIPTSQGTIYPEEVMQLIVDEANKRAEEGIMLAYVYTPNVGDTKLDIRDALGLVTGVDLVYGWIEIEVEPISIEGKFNPLNDDQFGCLIIPCLKVSRSSNKNQLIVHEASITHFTIDMFPRTTDKSTGWGARAKRIVEDKRNV